MVNFFSLAFASGVAGHGVMYEPPARQGFGLDILKPACAGASCLWFNQGTTIGCPKATGGGTVFPDKPDCANPAEPTIQFGDKDLRTYGLNAVYRLEDYTKHHPWRYPGSAPVENPCGIAGGWYTQGAAGNGGDAPPGVPQGALGTDLPKLLDQTVWIAGSTVEVAWGITANHGGGYQYRLCPASEEPTEACFQQHPLEFVGDVQWIQQGAGVDVTNRTEIPATRVTGDKVVPAGSIWTKNPIPACNTPISGGAQHTPCKGPIFPSPLPGGVGEAYGFGGGMCQSELPGSACSDAEFKQQNFDFGIVDKVKIPDDLEGDFVLSFRWESEQTPQVWASCGDVTIKTSGAATKPFSPTSSCSACVEGAICGNCTSCQSDKTGDCAYCWNPLPGYAPGAPKISCLGYDDDQGHAQDWRPGDDSTTGWSPGCTACWSEGTMQPRIRGVEDVITV